MFAYFTESYQFIAIVMFKHNEISINKNISRFYLNSPTTKMSQINAWKTVQYI